MPKDCPDRPNILIFLVDQMQAEVLEPGHPCRMPNLDRLGREGVRFTRTFGPSPHCCPARATFMSGLYPSRHGVFNNVSNETAFQHGLNAGVRLFSEHLKDAGYNLQHAGKWHVTNEETPAARGWEELSRYECRLVDSRRRLFRERAGEIIPPTKVRERGQIHRPGWGDTGAFGRAVDGPDAYERMPYYKRAILPALEAMPELASRGAPWAMCVSTDMVPESSVPKELADLYDPATVQLPASFADSMADKPNVYRKMRNQVWGQIGVEEARAAVGHYWALCSLQDRFFGDLLDKLDETGQADSTVVLFVGDHGDCNLAHGLQQMGIPSFRENYNVPAVARWPRGIKVPGRVVDEFVTLADFAPTFIELAQGDVPEGLTGRSLVPFLEAQTPGDWPDAWFSQTKGNECYFTQRIAMTKEWKYVCNWFDFDELYDLTNDPHEMVNLAHPDRYPQQEAYTGTPGTELPYVPWPRLPDRLEAVRRDLMGRMWRFAEREQDIVFNGFPPVAVVPYGPLIGMVGDPPPSP
jgi:arylsulfatase A-like enzyme